MSKTKILVVDDELIGRQLLQAVLVPQGFDILLAKSGTEAIELAQENTPNLVLMDVMMPDMDGFETVRRMKAIPTIENIPVMMVTALDDRDSRIKGLESGAIDYIAKPFDRVEIINKIKNRTSTSDSIPQKTTKSNEKINDSIFDTLVQEIINSNKIAENYSGTLEYSVIGVEELSILGQWTYKNESAEFLAFFGPHVPDEQSNFKNCLINMWLRNCSRNISMNPSDIADFIHSKMESSGFFKAKEKDWWFFIIIINDELEINADGFNKPFFLLSENSSDNESKSIDITLHGNKLTNLSRKDILILFSDNIIRQLEEEFTVQIIGKHISLPESATFTSTHESLIEKAGSSFSFGLKIGF